MTWDEAERLLRELRRRPPIYKLLEQTCRDNAVLPAEVIGARRTKAVARVRRHLQLAIRQEYGLSYPEIARLFGGHHTTIMHNVRVAKAERRACFEVSP